MDAASESARRFNRQICDLAERLATHDLVVTRMQTHWEAFGSWRIWLEAGVARDAFDASSGHGAPDYPGEPAVLRLTWDGKEGYLGVATADGPRPLLDRPEEWARGREHKLPDLAKALVVAEDLAIQHFAREV